MTTYQKRRAAGLCGYPGCPEMSEKSYCQAHMKKIAADLLRRRKDLEARGLCHVCGLVEVEGGPKCDDCMLAGQLKARAYVLRRKDVAQRRRLLMRKR